VARQEERQPVPPAQWKADLAKRVESQIRFTDDEVQELLTSPEKVLPRHLARTHVEVLEATYNAITAAIPDMIRGYMENQRVITRIENDFVTEFPDLKGNLQDAWNLAAALRQQNPNMPEADMRKLVGATLRVQKGYQPPAGGTPPTEPSARPFIPQNPGQGKPVALPTGQAKPKNMFEELAEEFLKEDM
jgi:hypothetical protein